MSTIAPPATTTSEPIRIAPMYVQEPPPVIVNEVWLIAQNKVGGRPWTLEHIPTGMRRAFTTRSELETWRALPLLPCLICGRPTDTPDECRDCGIGEDVRQARRADQ